jgi:hypothetical protein
MKNLMWLFAVVLVSCDPVRDENFRTVAYVPVYATVQASKDINSESARATVHPGKIYAYGNYLFQVEQNEGIHVIDNSNVQQAHKIAFIKVPGASELAIKSNYLYTNNMNDLVVLDLSSIQSPKLTNRVANAFPLINQAYPPASNTYFECPDPSKGIVIGWEEKTIENPKCRR